MFVGGVKLHRMVKWWWIWVLFLTIGGVFEGYFTQKIAGHYGWIAMFSRAMPYVWWPKGMRRHAPAVPSVDIPRPTATPLWTYPPPIGVPLSRGEGGRATRDQIVYSI